MSDHADSAGDSTFTPEEQAAWDAYESGADAPAATAAEPAGTPEPSADGSAAPNAAEAAAAPAGEPAAAPGAVVDDPDLDSDEDGEVNKGQWVRHGAFHQARSKYRAEKQRNAALESELNTLREQFTRGDERLKLLVQAAQAAPKVDPTAPAAPSEPEKAPDPNEDIFGAYAHLLKEVEALRSGHQKVTEAQQKAADEARASTEEQQVISTYRQDIARVAQADPSFVEAYQFLINARVQELQLFGLDQATAVRQANADELEVVRSAMQRGQSPAELMSRLAKSRGFSPKAPEPVTPTAPTETAADKAARAAAGAAGPGRSLSAAGGGPAGEVTIEMLASMSESDFEKFSQANPKKLAALMGAA